MQRVASLYLPMLAIERIWRMERPRAQPEQAARLELPVDDDPGACSVPRGGNWCPGARWARQTPISRVEVVEQIRQPPGHQQPPLRELGRRSEAADHPFKAMRPDEGGGPAQPQMSPWPPVQDQYAPLILDPVQAALVKHDGYQCGYCTPGQICSAVAVLDEIRQDVPSHVQADLTDRPQPTNMEVRERMSGNICRCGPYSNIVDAMADVAGERA